jgi:hypothetical protein
MWMLLLGLASSYVREGPDAVGKGEEEEGAALVQRRNGQRPRNC